VLEGDDLASIAKKYNTTVEELIALNPELSDGLTVGKYIVVPTKESKAKASMPMPTKLGDFFWYLPSADEKPKLHFAVILPLYLSNNDSVDVAENGSSSKVFEKSVTAIQFLGGFLTAMDTLAGLGYEIELDIYDSKNNLDVVRSIARKIDRSVDAIFGPLYSKNAELIASILKDIPVISPLSKTLENGDKPNLVNCVANQQSEFLAMASIIRQNPNSNVVFLNGKATGNKEAIKYVKSNLPMQDTLRVRTVWVTESFNMTNHLSPYIVKGQKNIVVVVDQNPVFISDLFTKLKNFRDSSVLLVTTSKIFDINTLENRYLNNQNFVGLSTEYINYADTTTQLFIKKFRVKTATEPSKYAFSGYDSGLYFAQLLAAFNGIPAQSEWPNIKGTSKGFYFTNSTGTGAKNNFIYKLHIQDFVLLETKQ
jgi:LysM repeat protein